MKAGPCVALTKTHIQDPSSCNSTGISITTPHHFYYYISGPLENKFGWKETYYLLVKLIQTTICPRGKSTVESENSILPSQEEETKNKRQQGASCQSVNPISKEDASTWHWAVNSQPGLSNGEWPCGSQSQQLPSRTSQINP